MAIRLICGAVDKHGNKCVMECPSFDVSHTGFHQNSNGYTFSDLDLPKANKLRDFNGVTSTALARLELIPKSTLESLAKRMELGIERKGAGAWNALTGHRQEVLAQKEFAIERLSHCIHHCYDAIRKLADGTDLNIGEDDAGAILFAGAVLAEFKRMTKKVAE